MAKQIRVLFDPDNLASRLFPRARALGELIEKLNAEDVKDAWSSDETIGWVYQYFNEDEKKGIFARTNKGQKVQASEIPAATQLFTPRWIVRSLVQNTLGRLWVQMHPDTRLREQLDYLVPIVEPPPAALRPVREITILDPACGTMHFGLVAFDLLAEMYREEIERAGEAGWPATPSVGTEQEIPASIVAHNLFGIDIDLRAVQLSALTLLLKARSLNPKARLSGHNLACADVLLPSAERLDAFIKQSLQGRDFDQRLMRSAWSRLKDATYLGSLLRLDTDLGEIISEERRKYMQPMLPGLSHQSFEPAASEQGFWDAAEERLIEAFNEFARLRAAEGMDERYFTGEAIKGLRLLDILLRRYDVVVTNPPYMGTRNMSSVMSAYLKAQYPSAKSDLYAAFIYRCQGLLAEDGYLGMITQQSFMFISSYDKLRAELRKSVTIETMIHVGPHAFAEIGGEKVNTTLFTVRREPDTVRRDNTVGTYLRLVKEPDAHAKQVRFEQALARLAVGEADAAVYSYRQGDFDAIEGAPWVYWIPSAIREMFRSATLLRDLSPICIGMRTGDNSRFLRYWWEVGLTIICRDATTALDASDSRCNWFPYMKGGRSHKWYGNQDYVVAWGNNGQVIKENTKHQYPLLGDKLSWKITNENYYFRRGVTWSGLTSGRFSARLSPGGFLFDVKGSSAFPEDIPYMLGLLNSSFASYCLSLLNPTISFQIGDLARVPTPQLHSDILRTQVSHAVTLACRQAAEQETSYDFVAPSAWPAGIRADIARIISLTSLEREIDEEVFRLYGISEADREAIEAELSIVHDLVDVETTADDEVNIDDAEGGGSDLADLLTHQQLAQRWISYAIGIVLGRFQPGVDGAIGRGDVSPQTALALAGLVAGDGIAVLEGTQPDHLIPRIAQVLDALLGPTQAEQVVAEAAAGRPLSDYLMRDFYKWHLQQYRKRPVYWLLQSPKRSYSLLIFHERLTRDSLYRILGPDYLGGAINGAHARTDELRAALHAMPQGRERKRLEAALADAMARLHDLEEFRRLITEVTTATNERGEVVGWQPDIDDGVLINMAPLHTLIPAWSAEPKKAWAALQRGDYDWLHTAMRYWPDRVRKACENNKSYAIAHGLVTS